MPAPAVHLLLGLLLQALSLFGGRIRERAHVSEPVIALLVGVLR